MPGVPLAQLRMFPEELSDSTPVYTRPPALCGRFAVILSHMSNHGFKLSLGA
jgi:hypothetical protein